MLRGSDIWVGVLTSGTAAVLAGCEAAPNGRADAGASPAKASYQTAWRDDFDADRLDPVNWAPEVSCWGGGNDERQCYTARPENVRVEEGALVLEARPERYAGPMHPPELAHLGAQQRTQDYTSGKVRTMGLQAWRYGRFSARMKLPEGQGTWPALWMMPQDAAYGRWPLSGEIDIMEAVNLGTPCAEDGCAAGVEDRTSGALHFGGLAPENTYFFAKADGTAARGGEGTPADGWHTYAVEWSEDRIQWFVDGAIFLRLDASDWYTASEAAAERPFAPFDQPFYLMANLAVGGRLAEESNGAGFDPASFPAKLEIDWVEVERCDGDATGRACLTDAAWDGTPQGPWEVQAR